MLEPTAGSIRINGLDIKTNMEEIRSEMGLCPQHNLLFADLTVEEHLLLFAKVKKMSFRNRIFYVHLLEMFKKLTNGSFVMKFLELVLPYMN